MTEFLVHQVQRFGRAGIRICSRLGESGLFLMHVLLRYPKHFRSVYLWTREMYMVGVLSLIVMVVSGAFIGMVLSLQGHHILVKFAAEQQLGQLIALSVIRELGPVVTALLFAGRAGSALSAELGLMRATKQIESMEMMAVDPYAQVVAPRFLAGLISLPLLTFIFDVVAIYGGGWIGIHWLGVDPGAFWLNMQDAVSFRTDVVNCVIKSVVFGFVITWIAVYQGFYSQPTASGISHSTTRTVVYSSLAVLGLDFVLTTMMLQGW